MKNLMRLKTFCNVVAVCGVVLVVFDCVAQETAADISTSQDCSKTDLQGLDAKLLTREEKIALLDQALLESLNNFEPCQAAVSTTRAQTAGGGAAGGGAAGSVQSASGMQGTENVSGTESAQSESVASVPVSEVQGDLPKPAVPANPQSGTEAAAMTRQSSEDEPKPVKLNGKLPEDIPPAANDDIIAEQFRQLAIEETDPVKKAKLWNQYRRYVGLPEKAVPQI